MMILIFEDIKNVTSYHVEIWNAKNNRKDYSKFVINNASKYGPELYLRMI